MYHVGPLRLATNLGVDGWFRTEAIFLHLRSIETRVDPQKELQRHSLFKRHPGSRVSENYGKTHEKTTCLVSKIVILSHSGPSPSTKTDP